MAGQRLSGAKFHTHTVPIRVIDAPHLLFESSHDHEYTVQHDHEFARFDVFGSRTGLNPGSNPDEHSEHGELDTSAQDTWGDDPIGTERYDPRSS